MTLRLRVVDSADAAVPFLLGIVRSVFSGRTRGVLGLATGSTFQPFLQALGPELSDPIVATHLDEYVGFAPSEPGGMANELFAACPRLRDLYLRNAFLLVPSRGGDASLQRHEERLQRAGGVELQLLGIGRNGHLAFHEPGTPFDVGFHVAELALETRDDARPRFAALDPPVEPPTHAATSGVATILAARRLVLCAFGAKKADAVRAMLHGEVGPACPASAIRKHDEVLVLLDRDAASRLPA